MSLVFNTKTYTADSFQQNNVGYIGAAKTVSVRDDLSLGRISPKGTAVFSGLGRTRAKLTRTLTLVGALTPTGDAHFTVDVAIPVGAASADIDAILNDMGALISGASFKSHVKSQQVSF